VSSPTTTGTRIFPIFTEKGLNIHDLPVFLIKMSILEVKNRHIEAVAIIRETSCNVDTIRPWQII
jgi:hypothetical protein